LTTALYDALPTESLPLRSCICPRLLFPAFALQEPVDCHRAVPFEVHVPKEREKTGFSNFTRVWRANEQSGMCKSDRCVPNSLEQTAKVFILDELLKPVHTARRIP
jgi:hypothetical protein